MWNFVGRVRNGSAFFVSSVEDTSQRISGTVFLVVSFNLPLHYFDVGSFNKLATTQMGKIPLSFAAGRGYL